MSTPGRQDDPFKGVEDAAPGDRGGDPFEGVQDADPFEGVQDADPLEGVQDAPGVAPGEDWAKGRFQGGWRRAVGVPGETLAFRSTPRNLAADLHRLVLEGRATEGEARVVMAQAGYEPTGDMADNGLTVDLHREYRWPEALKLAGGEDEELPFTVPDAMYHRNAGFLEDPTKVAAGAVRAVPMGVGVALSATGVGSVVGVPLTMASGFGGDLAAQEMELATGTRDKFSVGSSVVNTVLAGIPGVKVSPLTGTSFAANAAVRGAEGVVMGAGGSVGRQLIDSGEVDLREVGEEALFAGVFGAGAGVLGAAVERARIARAAAKAGVAPQDMAARMQARYDAEAEALNLARERAKVDPRFEGVRTFDDLEAVATKARADAEGATVVEGGEAAPAAVTGKGGLVPVGEAGSSAPTHGQDARATEGGVDPFEGVVDAPSATPHSEEVAVDKDISDFIDGLAREQGAPTADFMATLPKAADGSVDWPRVDEAGMTRAEDFPELHEALGREWRRRMEAPTEADTGPSFASMLDDGTIPVPSVSAENGGLRAEVRGLMENAGFKTDGAAWQQWNKMARGSHTVEQALTKARSAGFDISREEFFAKVKEVFDGGSGGYPTRASGVLSSEAPKGGRPEPVAAMPPTAAQAYAAKAAPVASLRGDEVPVFPSVPALKAWVKAYFANQFGGKVRHPELGEVMLDDRAVENTADHGMGRLKAQGFAALPEVLTKGRVVWSAPDKSGRPGAFAYIVAAPVEIGGVRHLELAMVKASPKDNRLYVHEVYNDELLAKLALKSGKPFQDRGAGLASANERGVIQRVAADMLGVKSEGEAADPPPSPSGLYWKSEYGLKPVPKLELPDWKAAGMPEVVRLVAEVTGRFPEVRNLGKRKGGYFSTGSGRIVINRTKAMSPEEALQILSHEFGHAADYGVKGNLDSGRVGSGNLLGRLAVLKDFRKNHLPTFPDSMPSPVGPARDKLKAAAEADLRDKGLDKPAKDDPNHAVWAEAFAKRFEELTMLRDKGALAFHAEVREELKALTMELRPWVIGVDKGYDGYRHSADELYADFFSALLASPGLAAEKAPLAWRLFFDHLNRKPEAARALLEMQALLQGGDPALRALTNDMAAMKGYGRVDDIFLAAHAARERMMGGLPANILERIRTEILESATPALRRWFEARDAGTLPEGARDLRELFSDLSMMDNVPHEYVTEFSRTIWDPLSAAGVKFSDFGRYMELMRVVMGDRAQEVITLLNDPDRPEAFTREFKDKIFNPGGIQLKDARAGVRELLRRQPDRGARLAIVEGQRVFQRMLWRVLDASVKAGNLSRESVENLKVNARGFYAPFVVADYFNGVVAGTLRAQGGTFKEIGNPALGMMLKMVTMLRAGELNLARREVAQALSAAIPGEWEVVAPKRKGGSDFPEPAPASGKELFVVRVDGVPQAWHIPEDLAATFDRKTGPEVSIIAQGLTWFHRNITHPAWITASASFTVTGVYRDALRAAQNMPTWRGKGVVMTDLVRNFLSGWLGVPLSEASVLARKYITGEYDPVLHVMLSNRGIAPPHELFSSDAPRLKAGDEGAAIMTLMRRHGAKATPHEQTTVARRVAGWVCMGRIYDHIAKINETNEAVGKISAFLYLTRSLGWTSKQAAGFISEMVGVPNTRLTGTHARIVEAYLPYSRVALRSWHQDIALLTGDTPWAGLPGMPAPMSPRRAKLNVSARIAAKAVGSAVVRGATMVMWAGVAVTGVMLALAEAGVFGEDLQGFYRRLPEYLKQGKIVIPYGNIGYGAGEQSCGLPIAMDDTQRFVFGAARFATLAAMGERTWGDAAESTAATFKGMLPGQNFIMKNTEAYVDAATGGTPRDELGRAILSDAERASGGAPKWKRMGYWSLDQMGVPTRLISGREEVQGDLSAATRIPLIKGFLVVTNAGVAEDMRRAEARMDEATKYVQARRPENARALVAERTSLQSYKAQLTPELKRRLEWLDDWHKDTLVRFEGRAATNRRMGLPVDDEVKQIEVRTGLWRKSHPQ